MPPHNQAARARAEAYGEVVHVACQVVPAGSCDTADGGSSSSGDVRLRLRVRVEAVSERARFLHASIFKMPLPSASVDVVYGQDPDGLANPDRVHAFRCVRAGWGGVGRGGAGWGGAGRRTLQVPSPMHVYL